MKLALITISNVFILQSLDISMKVEVVPKIGNLSLFLYLFGSGRLRAVNLRHYIIEP